MKSTAKALKTNKHNQKKKNNDRTVEEKTNTKAAKKSVMEQKKKNSTSVQHSIASKTKTIGSEKKKNKSKMSKGSSGKKVKEKEKWVGEETAINWTKQLPNVNLLAEYEEVKQTPVEMDKCRSFEANAARNRHSDYKCYDHNRIVTEHTTCDYNNATKLNLSQYKFPRIAILAQMPKLDQVDAVADFWKMIYQEHCSAVHIIAQPDELEAGFDKLFAQQPDGYFYANGFFVNTRKVEKDAVVKVDTFTVELLPEGCSDAVICQVSTHSYWKSLGGPEKFLAPYKAAQSMLKTEVDSNPVAIVSVRGAGRNAALLTLSLVCSSFANCIEPNIKQIVKSIREQKPMAVDSATQYISLYLATCWLLKAKLPSSADETHKRLKKFRARCDPTSSQMSVTSFEDPQNE